MGTKNHPDPNPQSPEIAKPLLEWFDLSARTLPWRNTSNPYMILVSEFMLQQTQVATVIPYFQRWMAAFPDFQSLAAASEQEVLKRWEGLGYYSRARNLHRAAQSVVQQFGGALPPDPNAIRALPGVGPYTAGAIASFAFNIPEPAVDANVQRVLARIFNIQEEISSAEAKAKLNHHARTLLKQADPHYQRVNAAIMELGALLCSPTKPACHRCPVATVCLSKDQAEQLPVKRPKAAPTRLNEHAIWDLSPAGLLLQLRNGPRWKGLWTLPETTPPNAASTPILVHRFAVTRYQISLHIHPTEIPRTPERTENPELQRIPVAQLERLPLAAPHRKAVNLLLNGLTL